VASASSSYDLIIVGGGPGGLTAGLYARRAAIRTILVEKAIPGGQVAITKGVENYPGFEDITGFDLSDKLLHHAQSYGLEVLREEVVAIEPGADRHLVRLANGDTMRAHALILATGGNARKLGVPGETENFGRGVSYCATCDGFFFRDRTVVVVGGGDSAVEEALYLSKLVRKIFIVHRRGSFKASKILQQRAMADPKIDIIWNTAVKEIKADGMGVSAVSLEDLQTGAQRDLETEGVFIFVGFSPNNLLVPPGISMSEKGYVITDEKCETSIPGIFVVGDLRRKYANQIVIATADGCVAALAAARYVETKEGTTFLT